MSNGKITLEDWKEFTPEVRDFHIWNKLQILDDLNKKFASKWTEKVIVWVGITIGGAFLLALANVVLAMK